MVGHNKKKKAKSKHVNLNVLTREILDFSFFKKKDFQFNYVIIKVLFSIV